MMRPNITKLTLEGFQVFRERVEIPLSRLTYFFGPNSSGKSAIEDALNILEEIFFTRQGNDAFDTIPMGRFERLKTDWRREGEGRKDLAEKLVLGVSFYTELHIAGCIASDTSPHLMPIVPIEKLQDNHLVELIAIFHDLSFDDKFENDYPYMSRDIIMNIDGSKILELVEFERASINYNHPLLAKFRLDIEFLELVESHPSLFDDNQGLVSLKSEMARVDGDKALDKGYFEVSEGINDAVHRANVEHAIDAFAQLFDMLLGVICENTFIHAHVVEASRNIPLESDLSFYIPSQYSYKEDDEVINKYGLHSQGDARYRSLAKSFANSNFSSNRKADSKAQDVNRLLCEYLFIERGYQVDFDYHIILDPKEFEDLADGTSWNAEPSSYDLLVQLFLKDAKGIRYAFGEVGSGLGYVLPVLTAICGMYSTDTVIVQQPELHLHPALQTKLGDAFIEKSADFQIIVETHSEHLLLRTLKRIRQTNSNQQLSDELKIQANDVAVLYFDPSPDGSTEVKHLRISQDGEFMDRWPRGFFDERYEELFDE